jgi:hypothetical protein
MHEEMEGMETRKILENLPPIDYAPILRPLGKLGLKKFRETYGITTPLLPNGIVDHNALVRQASELVSNTYRWQAPFFDEHHLHWEAANYRPDQFDGDTLPDEFRDLPIHKLWTPREFHTFIHAVTQPPPRPAYLAMKQSVKQFRRHNYIYTIANEAITLRERSVRAIPLPGQPDRVRDPETKRIVPRGQHELRRQEFIKTIESQFNRGLLPDLAQLSHIRLEASDDIQATLTAIRREAKTAIAHSSSQRRGRAVLLQIDPQSRQAA